MEPSLKKESAEQVEPKTKNQKPKTVYTSRLMNQEKVWDAVSSKWAEFRTRPVDEVKEFLKRKKGKVLDLGCGSGRNFIENKNTQMYGIDFSKKLLTFAKKLGYVDLKKSTTDKIPYPDNFFNHIIFVRVLHCVESQNKRIKTLKEIHRVLKPNGQALISTIGRMNKRIKNKPKESTIPWTVGKKKYQRYNYIYDKKEFEEQIKQAGFKIKHIEEDKNIVAIVQKIS